MGELHPLHIMYEVSLQSRRSMDDQQRHSTSARSEVLSRKSASVEGKVSRLAKPRMNGLYLVLVGGRRNFKDM